MPHPVTKQTLDQLTLERDLCRKLPERRFRVTRSRGEMRQRKKLMKEYADKRRNAQERSIVIGDTVLLKQNRADQPNNKEFQEGRRRVICWCQRNSVMGVKGTMVMVKRGRDQSLELITIQST